MGCRSQFSGGNRTTTSAGWIPAQWPCVSVGRLDCTLHNLVGMVHRCPRQCVYVGGALLFNPGKLLNPNASVTTADTQVCSCQREWPLGIKNYGIGTFLAHCWVRDGKQPLLGNPRSLRYPCPSFYAPSQCNPKWRKVQISCYPFAF